MSRITESIIIKSLQGDASPEEDKQLNDWLNEDKKNVEFYFQAEEIWRSRDSLSDRRMREEGWNKLFEKISSGRTANATKKTKRISGYAVAAAICLLIIGFAYYELRPGASKNNNNEVCTQHTVHNNKGIQKITLPDSSVVWLNGDGMIQYSGNFDRERLVALEGKGLFEIVENKSLPFIVRSANIDVVVTGTEFFVESPHDDIAAITLISGGVTVNYNDSVTRKIVFSRTLLPGQELTINTASGQSSVKDVDASHFIVWRDGVYRFKNEPLELIAKRISQHYKVDIKITSELKDKMFTGQIDQDYPIKEVMEILQSTHLIKYLIVNDAIYISEY